MNLTWHIVKKDLRAFRWPLLVWLLVIVAKLGVGAALLTSDTAAGVEWFKRMDALAKVLAGLECASFVLVAALVQEDMLVGTTAFWQTRPISGARLLRAKLVGITLVFLVTPIVVTLPWWLGCGYGVREIVWAATETFFIHAMLVLLGLLWAVVTDGFARFLAWTLVTLFAIPTLTTTIMYYSTTRGQHGPTAEVMATRVAIEVIIAVIGIGVVVVHQFLTRRTVRSIGIIGGFAGAVVLIGAFAPWSWRMEERFYAYLIDQAEGNWPASAEPAGLTYTLKSAKLAPAVSKSRQAYRGIRSKFFVDGLADTQALAPYISEHVWRWPDGATDSRHAWGKSEFEDAMAEKAVRSLGKDGADRPYRAEVRIISSVSPEIAQKLLATTPAYSLSARLRLIQLDSVAAVPKQAGPRNTGGATSERLANVEKDGDELLVTVVRHDPWLVADSVGGGVPKEIFSRYLVVNRARDFTDRGQTRGTVGSRVASVGISWQTFAYRAMPKASGPRGLLEAINALDEAELVRVVFSERTRFTHEIKTDAFTTELDER